MNKEIKIANIFEDPHKMYVYSFNVGQLVYTVTFLNIGNDVYNLEYILYSDGEEILVTQKPYKVGYTASLGVLYGLATVVAAFVDYVQPLGVEFRIEETDTDARIRLYRKIISKILKEKNLEQTCRVGTIITVSRNKR